MILLINSSVTIAITTGCFPLLSGTPSGSRMISEGFNPVSDRDHQGVLISGVMWAAELVLSVPGPIIGHTKRNNLLSYNKNAHMFVQRWGAFRVF